MSEDEEREELYYKYDVWKYGEEEAKKMKKEVEEYLKTIPPVKVSQRKKGDDITVENSLDLGRATVTVKASPESWKILNDLFLENQDQFAWDFYHQFILHALDKLRPDKPRGIHKGRSALVHDIKVASAWIYLFVKHWVKKDKESWPYILRQSIDKIENELKREGFESPLKTSSGRYDSKSITYYLVKKAYAKQLLKFKLRVSSEQDIFDDPEVYYNTYLVKSRNTNLSSIRKTFDDYLKDDEKDTQYIPYLRYILGHVLNA